MRQRLLTTWSACSFFWDTMLKWTQQTIQGKQHWWWLLRTGRRAPWVRVWLVGFAFMPNPNRSNLTSRSRLFSWYTHVKRPPLYLSHLILLANCLQSPVIRWLVDLVKVNQSLCSEKSPHLGPDTATEWFYLEKTKLQRQLKLMSIDLGFQ